MKGVLLLIACVSVSLLVSCEAERQEITSRTASTPDPTTPGDGQYSEVRVSLPEKNAAEPQIAATADTIYVVYAEHERGRAADIFLQKYSINAEPVGDRVRVSPNKDQARTWYGDPPTMAVGDDGSVYVAWTSGTASGKSTDVMLSASHDGGGSFQDPVRVNDDTAPASHGMHSVAVGREGKVYVAWLDERNVEPVTLQAESTDAHTGEHMEPNAEVYFSVSTDGGRTFSPNKKIASDVCPCCRTSMAVAEDGRLYVSWRQVLDGNFRHIAVGTSGDSGQTFAEPVIVSDDKWQIRACPMSGAALAATPEGVQVLWYTAGEAGQPGLYVSHSRDHGATFSDRTLVSADSIGGTPALLNLKSDSLYVFATENDTELLHNDGSTRIGDALLPAAATSGNLLFTTFVRNDGDRKEILLRKTDIN